MFLKFEENIDDGIQGSFLIEIEKDQIKKTYEDKQRYVQSRWDNIQKFLFALYKEDQGNQFSYNKLYEQVEDLVRNDYQTELYKLIIGFYKGYFEKEYKLIKKDDALESLKALYALWNKVQRNMTIIRRIFIWFESTDLICRRVKNFPNLIYQEFGLVFRKDKNFADKLIDYVLKIIQEIRNKNMENSQLLESIIIFFIRIDEYQNKIHPLLLKITENYYKQQAADLTNNELKICEYIQHVQNSLKAETRIIDKYLHISSQKNIIQIIEQVFIGDQMNVIMSELGFFYLLQNDKYGDVEYLYKIFQKMDKIEWIKKNWNYYIKKIGSELISKQETGIPDIIKYKETLDVFIVKSFNNDQVMVNSMRFAFESFLNISPNKIATQTSKFLDKQLKNKIKIIDEEGDKKNRKNIESALQIFKFIQAKDIFEAFYTQRLTKRLIQEKSANKEQEIEIIQRFKDECGENFTRNMESIEKDVYISEQLSEEFEKYLEKEKLEVLIEVKVVVVAQTAWCLTNYSIPVFFPPFDTVINHFTTFYEAKKSSKVKLKWQHECSSCVVTARYQKESYQLELSVLQAMVLLLFNNREEYTFQQLTALTKLDRPILMNTLVSLFKFKEQILIHSPVAQDKKLKFEPQDKFVLNKNYQSKKKRVKIHTVEKKKEQQEESKTTLKIIKERKYLIEAAIVKIMKTKNTIDEKALISEIFAVIKLPIDAKEILVRIEYLVSMDYMKRDANDEKMYHYEA